MRRLSRYLWLALLTTSLRCGADPVEPEPAPIGFTGAPLDAAAGAGSPDTAADAALADTDSPAGDGASTNTVDATAVADIAGTKNDGGLCSGDTTPSAADAGAGDAAAIAAQDADGDAALAGVDATAQADSPKNCGAELCNGLDDDCDGKTDEDLGTISCGVGACQTTVPACTKGAPSPCVTGPKAAELCNGVDDDCDGQTDESGAVCAAGGAVCVQGKCVQNCLAKGAPECPAGTVCNAGDKAPGKCVKPSDPCVVTNPASTCGPWTCGPGTACHPQLKQCVSVLPCTSLQCAGGACHGANCACKRDAPTCQVAPMKKLQQSSFLGGLVDIDIDLQCGAWGVTVLSGPDFLRHVAPDGTSKAVAGVTNLNMGEVAALQGTSSVFGGDDVEVALTYNCCASCGCQSTTPQGVAWFDPKKNQLPMLIPTLKFSSGKGPFGSLYLDTGPQGLTWGLGQQVYIGNVDVNGDMHTIDLATKKKKKLALFPARVHAATPFDGTRLAVALQDKTLRLMHVADGKHVLFSTLTKHATSLARDPFNGHLYVALQGGDIRKLSWQGKDLGSFAKAGASGRIALGPDHFLYHLTAAPVGMAKLQRFSLPPTL